MRSVHPARERQFASFAGREARIPRHWQAGSLRYVCSSSLTLSSEQDCARFAATRWVVSTPASLSAIAAVPDKGDSLGSSIRTGHDFFNAATSLAALKKSWPVRIEEPRLSPLSGTAAMALRDAGVETTHRVAANLAQSCSLESVKLLEQT